MFKDFSDKAKSCCRQEKQRVVDALAKCNSSGKTDYRRRCYRSVARRSGERAKQCMLSS